MISEKSRGNSVEQWKENLDGIKEYMKHNTSYADYLKERYEGYHNLCIFGAGNIGIGTAKILLENGFHIHSFCDNNEDKVGKKYLDIPCISVEELLVIKKDTLVVICTRFHQEIYEQLSGLGVVNIDRIFANKFSITEYLEKTRYEEVWRKINLVVDMLEDDKSKTIYTTVIKNWFSVECNQQELTNIFSDDQYFCEDIFKLTDKEILVDGGAYTGDTLEMFLDKVNCRFEKVYLFELCKSNYMRMLENTMRYEENIREKLIPINKGLSDTEETILYDDEDESSTVNSVGNEIGQLVNIDKVCDTPITYIKMDIEGSELRALEGAAGSIRKYKPKLAICLYHNVEDLWEIPLYIHKLMPEYRLYIRHHTDLLNETVCYAII